MRTIIAAALAVALTGGALAQGQGGHGAHGGHGDHAAAAPGTASRAYMDAMAKMDEAMGAMEMTGETGADFALMMIPHHQSAIDMAEAYLASEGQDAELTKLSREIIEAQEREIAFLKDWLARNGHPR
jgi:uncharacterized protein (DUF305 family)